MHTCSLRSVCQNHIYSPGRSGRAKRAHVEISGAPSKACSLVQHRSTKPYLDIKPQKSMQNKKKIIRHIADEDREGIISESYACVPCPCRYINSNRWRRANGAGYQEMRTRSHAKNTPLMCCRLISIKMSTTAVERRHLALHEARVHDYVPPWTAR